MAGEKINLPAGFGGLMRYSDEYESKFKISPKGVIIFLILILVFVIALRFIVPLN